MFRMSERTRNAREVYRAARQALDGLDCGHDYECDEYLRANRRVIAAEQLVPWWKRLDIDLTA